MNPNDYWGYGSYYARQTFPQAPNGLIPIKYGTFRNKAMLAADRYDMGYIAIGPLNKPSQFTDDKSLYYKNSYWSSLSDPLSAPIAPGSKYCMAYFENCGMQWWGGRTHAQNLRVR